MDTFSSIFQIIAHMISRDGCNIIVIQYNCWKNIPWALKLLFCINFMLKITLFKVPKICNINSWIERDPTPPLALFQKIIPFGSGILPLGTHCQFKQRKILSIQVFFIFNNVGFDWKTVRLQQRASKYESLSDVGERRVWFASKKLTPCRMHWNAFLIAQIIAKCHSFPNKYDML